MPDSEEYFKAPDIDWGAFSGLLKLEAEYVLYFAGALFIADIVFFGYLIFRIIRGKEVKKNAWILCGIAFLVALIFGGDWVNSVINLYDVTIKPMKDLIQ